MLKIGITGHMCLKQTCIAYYRNEMHDTLQSLQKKHGKVVLYSSLAEGADRLAVEVGMELGLDFVAVLPMDKDAYKQDFGEVSRLEFDKLLNTSFTTVEMPLVKNNTLNMIQDDINMRSLQYEHAGQYIVYSCDVVMALWDGKYTHLRGGTSEIVSYCLAREKYVLYHLKVSRHSDLTNDMIKFRILTHKEA
jgi:hypothetical protein